MTDIIFRFPYTPRRPSHSKRWKKFRKKKSPSPLISPLQRDTYFASIEARRPVNSRRLPHLVAIMLFRS